jgi:hypothetical protein
MNGTDMIRDYARVGVRLKLSEIQSVLEELYRDFPEEFAQKPQQFVPIMTLSLPRPRPARRRPPAPVAQHITSKPGKPWGALAWQRIHDYLAEQPNMTASASMIRKAVKVSDPMVYSITEKRPDLFRRAAPGVFMLKQKAHKP